MDNPWESALIYANTTIERPSPILAVKFPPY